MEILVGKTIEAIVVRETKIIFFTDEGEFTFKSKGEWGASAWIKTSNIKMIEGSTVVKVEENEDEDGYILYLDDTDEEFHVYAKGDWGALAWVTQA